MASQAASVGALPARRRPSAINLDEITDASNVALALPYDSIATTKASPGMRSNPRAGRCGRCDRSFSVLRRAAVCGQCETSVCWSCLSGSPRGGSPAKRVCVACGKVSAFEHQLARSFFSTEQLNGKRAKYPGLAPAHYHQWFATRCQSSHARVRSTEKKRARMLQTLRDRQLLHSPKWSETCTDVRRIFGTAVCFLSLTSGNFELIVGSCGDMLHYSCVPREIGMCDVVLGSADQAIVLPDVAASDEEVRLNPFLTLSNAGFFAGQAIVAGDVAVGIIALLDPLPRPNGLSHDERNLLKCASHAVGERVAKIVASTMISTSTPILRQCLPGLYTTTSITKRRK